MFLLILMGVESELIEAENGSRFAPAMLLGAKLFERGEGGGEACPH